jgi:hypothetical protein
MQKQRRRGIFEIELKSTDRSGPSRTNRQFEVRARIDQRDLLTIFGNEV